MKKWILAVAMVSICFAGCNTGKKVEAPTAPQTENATNQNPNAGGITPMTPTPVPNAPVAGSESLQGTSAGGVGQAAKDQARGAAGKAGGSSADQATTDASGE